MQIFDTQNIGKEMYDWIKDLFPIHRSLTGEGVRVSLGYIKDVIQDLSIFEVPSGTKCYDWQVPKEWFIRDAYIATLDGKQIIDYKNSNLHVVGYSTPIDIEIDYEELIEHLHYIKEQPDAIPYITSYYKERWGFCISYNEYKQMKQGKYKVKIVSELFDGFMTYGEVILKGKTEQEIFFSTYICHPSMASNELSGPVVAMALIKHLKSLKEHHYTYRFLFAPETIGSICYLSRNLEYLRRNVKAGFMLTTMGDDRVFSYIPSRYGNTIADKVVKHIIKHSLEKFNIYSFLERGSDERQYCSPGVDLPFVTICRSKYDTYPEYHTSLDNLSYVSPEGLAGSYKKLAKAIEILEKNFYYKIQVLCEPQLGKRGLYPSLSTHSTFLEVFNIINLCAYADGSNDLIDIADILGVDVADLFDSVDKLLDAKLISIEKNKK